MTTETKEEKTTDEIQNGGTGVPMAEPKNAGEAIEQLGDRVTTLEERINLIVRCNCLRESER